MRPQLLSAAGRSMKRGFATFPPRPAPAGYKFETPLNVAGWTVTDGIKLGTTLAAFGGVAGYFAVFFFSDVPRVREDIIKKVPFLTSHFTKEVHPADNPF